MKNWKINNLVLVTLVVFLSCKKELKKNVEIPIHNTVSENSKKSDTITLNITDSYDLEIIKANSVLENIDFFSPIKNKLKNEENYSQILYDKKNIVINLEIGQNADVYEDIYLSKKEPIFIEKITRTTIIKNDILELLVCEEKINKPLLNTSKYKSIDDKIKNCKSEKLK